MSKDTNLGPCQVGLSASGVESVGGRTGEYDEMIREDGYDRVKLTGETGIYNKS